MLEIAILAAVGLIALVIIGVILSRLYRRSNRETALVRTGLGGKKVVIDGGCLVLPLFHDVALVNMRTLRLEVARNGDGALITADRMRVDVGVEFYVRVAASLEGVATAAQTLGDRTWRVEELREMIEGKLIDGLRAVGAKMTMDMLHENRSDFVQQVHDIVSEDLTKNGLELEAVSLTALDQTPFSALDENNAFNAVGMRQLADVIAENRKQRAAIEADAEVIVAQKQMEAERRRYEIEREREQAQLAEEKQIELIRAQQEAAIAEERERGSRLAQEAEIIKKKALEEADIIAQRELEVARQEKAIILAEKSEEESRARAKADEAQQLATRAAEAVVTEREVAIAERQKRVEVLRAAQGAEQEAVRLKTVAEAERAAAEDRAAALREEAQAEADSITIRAEAKRSDLLAEAEGKEAINAAENTLSAQVIELRLALAKIERLPEMLAAMVKPIEKIEGIRINQIGGLGSSSGVSTGGGSQAGAGAGTGSGDRPLVNQAIDGLLAMQLQMPAVQKLGKELGLTLDQGPEGLVESVMPTTAEKAAATKVTGATPPA